MSVFDCIKWLAAASVLSALLIGCGMGMDRDKDLGAAKFELKISAYPGNGSAASPGGTVVYDIGSEARAVAIPNEGYVFTGWSGASDSNDNYISIQMRRHQTLTAHFRKIITGVFEDSRAGKAYRTVTIGKQTWMAQNLDYDVPENSTDLCYNGDDVNCEIYGRLYRWDTAQVACPSGWRLPKDADWTKLTDYLGDAAGAKLKAADSWSGDGGGADIYGFSALPGGFGLPGDFGGQDGGYFNYAGSSGCWWSHTPDDDSRAYSRYMYYNNENVVRYSSSKSYLFSVRCVQGQG